MNIQTIQPDIIHPNPWQPRTTIDPSAIAELAESIAAQGLLQPPVARAVNSHYELAFGHRRLLAWQNARPGEAMPLQVQDLTDRQMAEFAATENAARRDLNPVERALAMKRLIADFGLTQSEAGKLFGLGSQGAVSNAMRLLHLPDEVLAHVASGALPERLARRLLALVKHLPKVVVAIADETAKSDAKEDTFEETFSAMLHKHGKRLDYSTNFGTEEELMLTLGVTTWAKKLGLEFPTAPLCKGCEFLVDYESEFCVRPDCCALKEHVKREWMVAEATKSRGLLMAGQEHVETLFEGDDKDIPWAKALLKSKHPSLRIVVNQSQWDRNYTHESAMCLDVLGHRQALLGTTLTEAEMVKAVPVPKVEKKAAPTAAKVSPKQQAQNEEWRKREELRAQKERLYLEMAPAFAKLFPKDGAVLDLLINLIGGDGSESVFEKQKFLAHQCISLELDSGDGFNASLLDTVNSVVSLANRLKVKLPDSVWEVAAPPAVQGAPARAGAPTPGAKKPAAKKPAGKKK